MGLGIYCKDPWNPLTAEMDRMMFLTRILGSSLCDSYTLVTRIPSDSRLSTSVGTPVTDLLPIYDTLGYASFWLAQISFPTHISVSCVSQRLPQGKIPSLYDVRRRTSNWRGTAFRQPVVTRGACIGTASECINLLAITGIIAWCR